MPLKKILKKLGIPQERLTKGLLCPLERPNKNRKASAAKVVQCFACGKRYSSGRISTHVLLECQVYADHRRALSEAGLHVGTVAEMLAVDIQADGFPALLAMLNRIDVDCDMFWKKGAGLGM